jgi:hypothetical protein
VMALSDWMARGVVQTFWAAMQRGEFITGAAAQAGTYRKKGARWLVAAGGVRPRRGRDLKGRCLSFAEREEIALAAMRRSHSSSLISAAGLIGCSMPALLKAMSRRPNLSTAVCSAALMSSARVTLQDTATPLTGSP